MTVNFVAEEYGTVMVGLLAEGDRCHGESQAPGLTQGKVSSRAGSPHRRETLGQIAKVYGVHPSSVGLWKKTFLERGAEIFAGDSAQEDYERRIAELEQLLGKKEVEIALLKNFLRRTQ